MAHTKFFKDKLKEKLRRDLNRFGVEDIDSDYEKTILNYTQIFWDFRIKLRQHDIVVIIEVETKQENPINNLIKTLIWLNENSQKNPVIFLHFFDVSYNEIETPAKDFCVKLFDFIDRSHKNNFVYTQFPINELIRVAQAKRDTKGMARVLKRISDITNRIIYRLIRDKYPR